MPNREEVATGSIALFSRDLAGRTRVNIPLDLALKRQGSPLSQAVRRDRVGFPLRAFGPAIFSCRTDTYQPRRGSVVKLPSSPLPMAGLFILQLVPRDLFDIVIKIKSVIEEVSVCLLYALEVYSNLCTLKGTAKQ